MKSLKKLDAFSETATQAQEKIGLDEESEKGSKKKSCNKEYVSKFPCQQCNYQAKRLAHLQVHVEAIHGTVKYSCPQCNYKINKNTNIASKNAKIVIIDYEILPKQWVKL